MATPTTKYWTLAPPCAIQRRSRLALMLFQPAVAEVRPVAVAQDAQSIDMRIRPQHPFEDCRTRVNFLHQSLGGRVWRSKAGHLFARLSKSRR
jgi:hypothetical protein